MRSKDSLVQSLGREAAPAQDANMRHGYIFSHPRVAPKAKTSLLRAALRRADFRPSKWVGPALFFSLFAGITHAQDSYALQRSTVTLTPSTRPGVVAEVHFNNSNSDAKHITEDFLLSLGGLTIGVTGTVGLAAPDTITVETPEGLIPVPRTLTIEDGTSGVVLLYPMQGVGS